MSVTIKDLARESGVSISTVSYVLNNGPRQVSEETRNKVLETARRLQFEPNAVARALSRKRMDTLGVLYTYWEATEPDYYFVGILHGILGAAMRHKQNTMLFTANLWEDVPRNLPSYCDGRCDGLLVVAPPTDLSIPEALHRKKMPFMLIGDMHPDLSFSCVDIDNEHIMRQGMQYLVSVGHRRIALLSGNLSIRSAEQRLAAYHKSIQEFRLELEKCPVLIGVYSRQAGYSMGTEIVRMPPKQRPTALFCGSDNIAAGAMQALQEHGIRIPGDVSVLGIDDTHGEQLQIPLTTMRQPLSRIGSHSAEMLLRLLQGGRQGMRELISPELILRQSVAPPIS